MPMLLRPLTGPLLLASAAPALAQAVAQPVEEGWTDEVIVTGTRDAYAADEASVARGGGPLADTPQSIQVLTGTLIREQDLRTLPDALANVSGTVPALTEEAVLAQPLVRGFEAQTFLDGLPAFGSTATADPATLAGVERIEVAKGPTATLFAGGLGAPVGGLINVVTAAPGREPAAFLQLRAGAFDTLGLAGDATGALGPVTLRLSAEGVTEGSHIDSVDTGRLVVRPSARLQLGADARLTVRGLYGRLEQLEYSGIPLEVLDAPGVSRFRFSGAADAPETVVENLLGDAVLDVRLGDGLDATIQLRRYENDFREYGSFVFPAFFPGQGTRFPLLTAFLPSKVDQWTADAAVLARFRTGMFEHRLLAGAAWDGTDYRSAIGFNFRPVGVLDYASRRQRLSFGPVPAVTRTQTQLARTLAGYLQDEVTAGPLTLQASVRLTRLALRERELEVDETYTKLTPRVGASLEVARGFSLFAGYGEGFRAVGAFAGSAAPVPETSRGMEAGLKFAALRGLTGTVAAYRLTRDNVPTADPLIPFQSVQTGRQRSQGLEADLVWEPSPAISLLAAYAYTDAEVTRDNAIPIGDDLARVPRHAGRIAARYRFRGALDGLGIGLGVTARSGAELTLPNSLRSDGFAIADAQASWTRGPATLGLNVRNLFDADYELPYQYLLQPVVIPGEPQSVFASFSFRF